MELLNKDKIRKLGEKENYTYLEADTIKQMEMKKIRNSIPWESESGLTQNSVEETLSKEYIPGRYHS